MRITIVNGFFLPVPPISGGATEKSWYELARQFVALGHEVTFISRRWPGMSDDETKQGIRHLRLSGFDHRRRLWLNLLLDFIWSCRVHRALPEADIVVVNALALPVWLGGMKPAAGKVVLLAGRMPKGQYRRYRQINRIYAPSHPVRERILRENPRLAPLIRISGYPINWLLLNQSGNTATLFPADVIAETVAIGYIGRLHKEKGLRLLTAAISLIGETPDVPPWRVLLCGPSAVAQGGSGEEFRTEIHERIAKVLPPHRFQILDPEFDEKSLASLYRRFDIFCYPSLAAEGETFGVAVAEAMAAGVVPVVSRLPCFADFVEDGVNGLTFDHSSPQAARQLADALIRLIRETAFRHRLAIAASTSVQRYDFRRFAKDLITDFQQLTGDAKPPTSSP